MMMNSRSIILVFVIILAWFPLFFPRAFVSWDDHENYTKHPQLSKSIISLNDVISILITPVLGTIEPFANIIKLLVVILTGWKPKLSSARAFLVTNLLFHAINTVLIAKLTTVRLLYRYKKKLQLNRFNLIIPIFFAIHPLRVECIAWASCLPYQLATFWCLLGCILHETKYTRTNTIYKAFFIQRKDDN